VADPTFISQEALEAAPDDAATAISQEALEVGADDAATAISQEALEAGVGDAATFISQQAIEAAPDDAGTFISQLCIEYSLGDEIPPPPPEPATSTFVFDEGEAAVEWWIVPQLTDSGVELRDKVVKAVRVTGLVTDADVKVYTYGPSDPVVVSDLEDGINSVTGAIPLPDTTNVAQSPRLTANCPNAMLSTVRVAGTYSGTGPRNRVDEMLYELAQQGVRR
jgi:hypothetical protein